MTSFLDVGTLHALLDLLGISIFAVTGALVAARHNMDPFGFMVLGIATGIGGGTLRDLVLGVRPVFWVTDQWPLVACIVVSLLTFWAVRHMTRLWRLILWLDALGMAMFAVAGTQKAATIGADPVVCVLMGVMTACFGGLLRDVLSGDKPIIFHKEIYASAATSGAVLWMALGFAPDIDHGLRSSLAFACAFGIRGCAIHWGWNLPHYRPEARDEDD